MKKNTGFTLLELLITVTLISIVMAIGVPSMRDFIKNDRLSTQINTLVGHLAYARSEAVLRHVPVIVCASSTLTSCNSSDWAEGWIIFVDDDSNSDLSAGEDLLRQHQPPVGRQHAGQFCRQRGHLRRTWFRTQLDRQLFAV